MATIRIDELGRFLVRQGKETQKRMLRAALEAAERGKVYIVQAAIPRANPPPVDRGLYRNSWGVEKILDKHGHVGVRLFSDSPYAGIIEFGRRPGTWPNIGAIREWVYRKFKDKSTRGAGAKTFTRKNTAAGGSQQRELDGIAFMIARQIKEKGVPPKHILLGSVPQIKRYFSEAWARISREKPKEK